MNGEQPNQALRSEVERSLREKERRLATLLSNLPGMAYRCRNDSNWTMEFVSDGCVALTGYPAADLVSGAVPYNSLIHPNDRERVWNEVQDALQQGLPFRFTYRIRSAHGRETWVWEQGVGVYSGGELEALEGFITDITDRKNTEANLEAQRERFQKIVENTDAGYFRIGLDGCYEDVNQAWARMHGFARREDAIGLNASAVQVPEDLSRAYQVVDQLMNGEAVKSGEFTRLRRDGSIGYHTFSANPVLDGDRVVGIEGFLVDTTGLKSAEQERRQTEQRYRSLFGSMQEGVAIHKLIHTNGTAENYILLDVNRRYEKILGVRREDVVNKAATEAYGIQGAPYLKVYSSVVATGTPLQFETYFAPMDKHFVISVAPMGDDLFATIFFDVTEWKRTQQAIQQANEAVASAERHYRLMFNSVSDAVFVHRFDEDGLPGHFVDVNDNACRHLGYAREELLRMGPCDIDDPEEHAATLARAQRLRLDGHGIWEGTHVAKDGRRIPVEVNTSLVDLDGTQTMISCARDISKRKEAEKRWREIFDGALEGIYRISTQKKIVAANSAMARMVGYDSPEELVSSVNDTTEQLWLNPDDRDRLVALLEGQGSVGKFECQFKRKDSTAVPVSINVHRVCGADGRTLFYDGFVQDITERKRAEETLREYCPDSDGRLLAHEHRRASSGSQRNLLPDERLQRRGTPDHAHRRSGRPSNARRDCQPYQEPDGAGRSLLRVSSPPQGREYFRRRSQRAVPGGRWRTVCVFSAGRHGAPARGSRKDQAGRPVAPGSKAGKRRQAGGRRGSRFQQPSHGDQRLQRHAPQPTESF
jgi:PAS domain S-box-containing protein